MPANPADGRGPKPNQLLVTASFGRILRKGQLDLFSPGRRLNVHPSLLPHYRGPAPIQHTLLNGEKETGVCVIEMLKTRDGAVDSGDIWGCEKTVIYFCFLFFYSKKKRLYLRLANRGRDHLEPITGHPGETGRGPSRLCPPTNVTLQGFSFFFPFPLLPFNSFLFTSSTQNHKSVSRV